MTFDWLQFLDQHAIDYVTSGPNTSRGNPAIKCRLCPDDPSEHLVIRLGASGRYTWSCRRNRQHTGDNVALVQMLLNCSWVEARRITASAQAMPHDFRDLIDPRVFGLTSEVTKERVLELPSEFKPFANKSTAQAFLNYLSNERGIHTYAPALFARYGLMYCLRGPFAYRIIFPVEFEGKLVSWTGRTIGRSAKPRYKALTTNPNNEEDIIPAIGPINNYLLWYDQLMVSAAHTLIVTEGPLDALKIESLGRGWGIRATCLFTNSPSARQVEMLHALLPHFKRKVLLLDADAFASSLNTMKRLHTLGLELKQLPPGIKDPGMLNDVEQIFDLLA